MASLLRRARNLLVRAARGLPPHHEAVSPEIDDDLFRTHLALYRLAGGLAAGRRVCDLGCGTGYGAAELLQGGAREVVGIDRDVRAVRYARRRFARPGLSFVAGDARSTLAPLAPFDLVVAINVLAETADAEALLAAAAGALAPGGSLVASVPPILDAQTLDLHRRQGGGRTNLYLWDWEDRLRERFAKLRLFRQRLPAGDSLRLGDPSPSAVAVEALACEEIRVADLYDAGTLTAVWVASEPRR